MFAERILPPSAHCHPQSSLSQEDLRNVFLRYATKFETAKDSLLSVQPLSASPPLLSPSTSTSTLHIDDTTLSLDAFSAFILSSDNSAFTDQHGKIYHDMKRPLCDYFISSSHNTYLVGNQVMGDSTIEGYIRALLQGCRSVECKPVVWHYFPCSQEIVSGHL